MASDSQIVLFCLLHPASTEKRDRVIHLLHTCYDYHNPNAQTTTWCYFTPSRRPGAPNQIVQRRMNGNSSSAIAGIEIYSKKSALSHQLAHPEFKRYHATATAEELYAQPEDMNAWYPREGFVARGETSTAKAIVVTVLMQVKEGASNAADVLEILGSYASKVKLDEPNVLTYCVLTRPKAPSEILIFERYADVEALKAHFSSKGLREMLERIKPMVKGQMMNEWEEVDKTFVGNVLGGGERAGGTYSTAKL